MEKIKLYIQKFADGKVVIDTDLNTKNFENGLAKIEKATSTTGSTIKNIVAGLGIAKMVSVAMNSITNSIDSAISRVDTLNNFPKVMSNLGISSEEAEKSIAKMSDKLAGLPTTLDQGASAVQRFTSKNGDVSKSTDLFLALNNAILAGGASAEIQSSALEQLSQAYAKGKPDMMEWRTAMTAMPAQLKQVAQSMGYVDADSLGEALRDGTASMDEFMDAIVRLNTEGIDGFQSFEEQARNSTGGIRTAITVAKTQVVKGVADIINALNTSLEDTKFGSLANIIEKVGKKAKEMLDVIAEYIPTIVQNLDKIIPMLGLLGVGFSTIKPDGIIGAASAFGNLVGKINSSAGLITKIVSSGFGFAALGGLILVAMGLAEDNFGEGINNMLNTAIEKGPEIITNLANGLVSKLPDIMGKGAELIEKIIETINANLPAIVQAGIKIISGLITGLAKALPKLIPQVVQVILTLVSALIENMPLLIDAGMQLLLGLVEGIVNAIPTLIEMLPTIIKTIIDYLLKSLPQIIQAGIQIMIALINGLVDAIPQLIAMLPEIIMTIIETLLENLPMIIDAGIQILVALIQGLVEAIPKLIEMLPKIIWQIATTLVENLPKIIAVGAKVLTSLIQGITQVLGNLGKIVAQIVSTIVNKIKELPGKMLEIGKNLVKGIWNGITNTLGWILDKIKGFGSAILKGIKGIFGIKSPSKLMRDEVGKYLAEGIGVGFEDEIDDVYRDMQNALNAETDKMTSNIEVGNANRSISQILTASATFEGMIPLQVDLDGEVIYDNQQKVSARKNLQYGGVR